MTSRPTGTPRIVRTSAIVLAGGRSRRFGADKLAAAVRGEPLLHHAVRAVAGVVDEVLVAVSPAASSVTLPADLPIDPIRVIDSEAFGGPLPALVDAASRARGSRLLVVAGDMPDLQPPLLRRLVAWSEGRAGARLETSGPLQPLPSGLDRETALGEATRLVARGTRSLRALVTELDMELVPEREWRSLDPEARSLVDVDRPADLSEGRWGPQARGSSAP